jgi:hypothetical protein
MMYENSLRIKGSHTAISSGPTKIVPPTPVFPMQAYFVMRNYQFDLDFWYEILLMVREEFLSFRLSYTMQMMRYYTKIVRSPLLKRIRISRGKGGVWVVNAAMDPGMNRKATLFLIIPFETAA